MKHFVTYKNKKLHLKYYSTTVNPFEHFKPEILIPLEESHIKIFMNITTSTHQNVINFLQGNLIDVFKSSDNKKKLVVNLYIAVGKQSKLILSETDKTYIKEDIDYFNKILSRRKYSPKDGTLDNDWFKGHIKQIYINENNQPFSYPHKPVILKETLDFYKDTLARLNAKNFQDICQQKMTKKEFDYYQYQNNEAQALLQNVTQFIDIPHLENVLLKIQSIPTFPKAITFANVYQIKNCNLTENELKFMEKLIPYINPDMFASQRALEKHMRTALNLYNEHIDKNTFKKMKPLRITYNWLKTEFDNISDDIFIF